jgi:AraC-like DNA-binding protein
LGASADHEQKQRTCGARCSNACVERTAGLTPGHRIQKQIAFALRQAEAGTSVEEICRKLGVSEPTFHRWS